MVEFIWNIDYEIWGIMVNQIFINDINVILAYHILILMWKEHCSCSFEW